MKVYITLLESRCSEHGGKVDEMFCRVTSTMQKAKDCCQEVEWVTDDENLAVSKWVELDKNYWSRFVIFEEEVL